ncbi:glycosyltransferase [Hyphomicrobium sp. B1]|uniref:glycosyltransferase n=1 Tax=Hyphomicrobium sp. B1 TaxID=3075651 RepID=UPI003C2D0D4C
MAALQTQSVCGVSVVMPVYNGARYLDAAIDSILRQTFSDFELLIIDDGSTDGSYERLLEWQRRDERTRLIGRPHRGIVACLNEGLAAAQGAIILRMDADDVSFPQRLERQVAFLKDNPGIAVVGSAIRFIDIDGNPLSTAAYPTTPDEAMVALDRGNAPVAHPAIAMRRDAALAVGGYRPLFDFAEDFDLWLRLVEHHQISNLPDVLLEFRVHDKNVSTTRRWEQALAAHIARFSAKRRRAGFPDPVEGVSNLKLEHLEELHLSAAERSSVLADLAEAALVSYEAGKRHSYLLHAFDSLMAKDELKSSRDRRSARKLIAGLWMTSAPSDAARLTAQITRKLATGRDLRAMSNQDAVHRWLLHGSDPTGPLTGAPRDLLSAQGMQQLVIEGDAHGVLPILMDNIPGLKDNDDYELARNDALSRRRIGTTFSAMLRIHCDAILRAAKDLPLTVVKGQTFARVLYPKPSFRQFTDIDLLVAPDAVPAISEILAGHGFVMVEDGHDPVRLETKWLHRDNATLMVEVHTNLVHHPKLRSALSLAYEDIADGPESAAALMTIAALHGALHRFERLRQVVDICQAARHLSTHKDEAQFARMLDKSGARFAAVAGLELAYSIFREPRCREIAREIGPTRYTFLARALIGRSAVVSTMSSARLYHSWRRQLFRMMLMKSRTFQGRRNISHPEEAFDPADTLVQNRLE